MDGYCVIRESTPDDTADIERLAVAQYQRTPWPLVGVFDRVDAFLVYEARNGSVTAALGYRAIEQPRQFKVMHVWAQDGFGGRRGAVALMLFMETQADLYERALVFDTMPENIGLQRAVAEHGCEPEAVPGAIMYRREPRGMIWAAHP